ncbi:MAG: hypothetical protein HYS32_01930 [Candidatus Woesearchaeota archaeon]|nr:MAG: hypothetical protein HYS32_01930 [Candidatus Woesearchaeota archaeon]
MKKGGIILVYFVFLLVLISPVFAQEGIFEGAFDVISGFITNYERNHIGIDSLIYFSLFLSILIFALKKKLGDEGKSAAKVLSIILSIALTLGVMVTWGKENSLASVLGNGGLFFLTALILVVLGYLAIHYKIVPEEQKGVVIATVGFLLIYILTSIEPINNFLKQHGTIYGILMLVGLVLFIIMIIGIFRFFGFVLGHTRAPAVSKEGFEQQEIAHRQKQALKRRKQEDRTYKELLAASANVAKAKEVLAEFTRFLPNQRNGAAELKNRPIKVLMVQLNWSHDIVGRLSKLHSSFDSYNGLMGMISVKLDEMGVTKYNKQFDRYNKNIHDTIQFANKALGTIISKLADIKKLSNIGDGDWGAVIEERVNLAEAYTVLALAINAIITLDEQISYLYAQEMAKPEPVPPSS